MRRAKKQVVKASWYFVMKHRGANHPVADGVYADENQARKDFESVPGMRGKIPGQDSFCHGCGIGCYDEYEIVRVFLRPLRVRRLRVKCLC